MSSSSLEFFAGSMFQQPVSRRATGPVWHAVGRGTYAVEAASGVVLESVFQSRPAAGAMSPALLARLVANEATLKALLTLTAAPVQHGAVRCSQRPAAVVMHQLDTHARPGPLSCPQASNVTLQRRAELMSRCAARFLAGSTRSCLTSQIWRQLGGPARQRLRDKQAGVPVQLPAVPVQRCCPGQAQRSGGCAASSSAHLTL